MSETLAILNTLDKKGWRTASINGGWRLSHRQTEGVIYMSITPQRWVCFVSPLLEEGNKDAWFSASGDPARLSRTLLEKNEQMFMTKFALDNDDTPLLMAEMALKDAHPLLPLWAVESLTRYKSWDPSQPDRIPVPQDQSVTETEFATAQPLTDIASGTPNVVKVRVTTSTSASPQHSLDVNAGVADDTIRLYLKGIEHWGWRIKEKLRGFAWHFGYRGSYREFDVYLTSSRNWMCLQVPVLVERIASVLMTSLETPDAQRQRMLFLKYLLHLNHSWFMAKLGLSVDNQVLLLLEIPTETLDFSAFRHATRALGVYLDRFEQEIQIMASLQHNKRLFELLHT